MSASRVLSRVLPRAAVAAVAALALSGCIKMDMDLGVQSDNTVDGTVIFGVSKQLAALPGFDANDLNSGPVESPKAGHVTTKKYDDGTWVGTQMDFTDVPLSEFGASQAGDLSITREGDEFKVSGSMDLSEDSSGEDPSGMDMAALASSAEIRLRLTFPGEVVSSNGTVDGNSVTWTPKFGEKAEITAVAKATGGGSSMTWLLVGGLLAALALVGGFLFVTMRRKGTASTPVPEGSIVPGLPAPAGTPTDETPFDGPAAPAAPSSAEAPSQVPSGWAAPTTTATEVLPAPDAVTEVLPAPGTEQQPPQG